MDHISGPYCSGMIAVIISRLVKLLVLSYTAGSVVDGAGQARNVSGLFASESFVFWLSRAHRAAIRHETMLAGPKASSSNISGNGPHTRHTYF